MVVKKSILFLFGLFFSTIIFATSVNKIVVFGDSLSDTGNLYEYFGHNMPPSPPYFNGRFSNGPVWVELLSKSYYPNNWSEHLLDYAFGGAGVSFENIASGALEDGVMFTLSREIDSYLLSHQDKADENSLFAVWIGSNNYLSIINSPEKTALNVNRGIRKSIELLIAKGAKHFLVINIPDMGKSPAARMFYAEKKLSFSSMAHNVELQRNVEELQKIYPSVDFFLFDADKAFAKVLANPEEYGYTNMVDTCYQSMIKIPSSMFVLNMAVSLVGVNKNSNACNGFFFFDPVHPSAYTHELIAKQVLEFLENSDVGFV